ncbi:DNA polymerase IV [Pseudoalteromonas lipolytica]|jgi:DNA polymerase-4|uniref:DNA polymerase IV n=1 Tax=Pseudoalteromonas lipolytica TaxID=570156 RepID=A0AAD0S117_9GAMM|nr:MULTISPECIES: DNA polymerase IV [Pseudoalteromonas]AXV66095.1 DNA polymerase IV [Pseudoalteromonas donghaensis]EWH07983.1 DNA polymerase IV [Pseudoalteromonas lipolytica SCSIO 04301]MBE0350445.1 DNA polymerase IV [Pseudoalteromonas lipolytica LMEB 39]MCC9660160.1 DNA polymerase IV [Pseudoalteromonas sp. MB41]QLJ07615.1 DNA polymerase IV [Pseudoalteromonas sp. JSTW]
MKKFIHIDMDCFFAAVEMRDNPALASVPLAIGGNSRRGVLSTANYIARQYGVRSAMSNYHAKQLCPDLVIVPGRMHVYKEVSQQIREIFAKYTDLIEPLSLDEAYLDVTQSSACRGSATLMAEQIRQEIFTTTGLTASAGIAPIKFIAKIASDENKPNGQCVVLPEQVDSFLAKLPLGKIPGVGKVTLEKLQLKGLYTGADVREKGVNWMQQHVGNFGVSLYQKCAGEYVGKVSTERVRKSLSVEHTYEFNKNSLAECLSELPRLMTELVRRLERQQLSNRINKLSVKVKFANFTVTSADQSHHQLDDSIFTELMSKAYERGNNKPVRLLGIGVGIKSEAHEHFQLSILD